MPDLDALLTRGYFPKELPPPFKTISFGHAVLNGSATYDALSKSLPPARLAHHNLARPGNVHRRLGLPNPAPYLQLCKEIVCEWKEIETAFGKSPLSLSGPTDSPVGRALNPRVALADLPVHRAAARAGCRFLLTADIARFYPSIYTHSIPWALHTKPVSKSNKGNGLLGNRLDKLVRSCQDGQTVGIPIGPDTSLVLAELVMSAADIDVAAKIGECGAFRYIDDIELAFNSAAAAEAGLGPLQEVLGHFELALNPSKTQMRPLPEASEESWIARIREFKISKKPDRQGRDLIAYFDLAFEQARKFPTKTVLNYAVASLRGLQIDASNADVGQDLVLQSLVNEAGVARYALEMLVRWRAAGLPLKLEKISYGIETMIRFHAPLMHGSEVAWALWGAIALDIFLSDEAIKAALRMSDPVVSLLALDCQQRALTSQNVSDFLASEIGQDTYCSERWLLLYEGVRRGWLPGSLIDTDEFTDFFALMSMDDVSFYDADTELAKIQRPADQLHGLNLPVVGFVFGY